MYRSAFAGVIWVCLAVAAQADADFGGSFEEGGAVQPVPPPPPPAAPGGDFGGSFGEGDLPVAGTTPPPPPPPPAAPGGGDFGDAGSFDPGGAAAAVTPQAPVVAPVAEPAPVAAPSVDPQIEAFELRDFGVPPVQTLRSGQFHAPTPTVVPGAKTVTTDALVQAINGGLRVVLIDVLGGTYSLPNAYMAAELASPGSFSDRTQQRAGQWLGQITGGDVTVPLVIYCSGPECWLSYNAVLRTVAAGYTNVYWYRGGLDAWQMAGLQLQPAAF